MGKRHLASIALFALAHALSVTAFAGPFAYSFEQIADTSGAFMDFRGDVSINNSGTVAFLATPRGGGQALVVGDGRSTTTLYDTSGPFAGFVLPPAINDRGDIGFLAVLKSGTEGVFAGHGGPFITIADTSGAFSHISSGGPISNSGLVTFSASLKAGGDGVFVGSGGPVTTIADSRGPFKDFSSSSINESGTVAFATHTQTSAALVTGKGGPLTIVYDSTGPFQSFSLPAINDSGELAFFSQLDDLTVGIFAGSGGAFSTIALGRRSFLPRNAATLNNDGLVAFDARFGSGSGIFTGSDSLLDRVIATGDPLFGSTVVDVDLGDGLNDRGQIAFRATLADGRRVIARADIVSEPSTITLLALGAVSLLFPGLARRTSRAVG